MKLPKSEVVDLDEYRIEIDYDGKGGLEINVFDELGGLVEGLYISDAEGDDSPDDLGFNISMN